jgi:hypothetical protein
MVKVLLAISVRLGSFAGIRPLQTDGLGPVEHSAFHGLDYDCLADSAN